MARRATRTVPTLLLHGLDGPGPDHWYTWLAAELTATGREVRLPQLPASERPELTEWQAALEAALTGLPDDGFDVLCHSLGCLLWLHHTHRGSNRSRSDAVRDWADTGRARTGRGSPSWRGRGSPGSGSSAIGSPGSASPGSASPGNASPGSASGTPGRRSAATSPRPARVVLVAPPSPITVLDQARSFFPVPMDIDAVRRAADGTVLVAGDDDPWCPEGAASAYGLPLRMPTTVMPGAGHLNPDSGHGPWPAVLNWCGRDNLAFIA